MDQTKRTLSEISHLFLSEVRERQMGDAPRPVRIGPKSRPAVSIDMTPDEYVAAFESDATPPADDSAKLSHSADIAVVLASHLGDQQSDRVRQYARKLAGETGRVGLIELAENEFSLICYEKNGQASAAPTLLEELDGRKMSEMLAELAFDIDRWIVFLPNPRTPEAQEILRHAPHWLLLTMPDHDGVVATYRTLKGFAGLAKPRISLVVLNVHDTAEADAVFRKLDGVSRQFLGCPMQASPPLHPAHNVAEHLVLHCRSTRDKISLATAPQWKLAMDFITQAVPVQAQTENISAEIPRDEKPPSRPIDSAPPRMGPVITEQNPMNIPSPSESDQTIPLPGNDPDEVIDLPAGESNPAAILSAVLTQGESAGQWAHCPIKAPMCPDAILAVDRDHRLVLLAVAGKGLSELRSIGLAYRWMSENRNLIRMALPQFSIDAHDLPLVKLLVDHTDLTADLLQPLLQTTIVSVQAYRKLKWGAKTGLLLEAA